MSNENQCSIPNNIREEDVLYQVVDIGENSVFLQNTNNNKVFEENNISKELKEKLGNDCILRYKNGDYIFEEQLTDDFFNSLVSIKEYEDIKNKFIEESNILQISSDTIFTIVSREKDYSLLGYENENIIKVPNVLIPFFVSINTKLNYKDGKFLKNI